MQISIVGRNVEVTPDIQGYSEKRLQKLKKYFPYGTVDVHVVMYQQRYRYCAEVTMNGNGLTVHAEEASESLTGSLDMVVDKLDAQIRRHKDRIIKQHQKHRNQDRWLTLNISVYEKEDVEQYLDEGTEPQVIHQKTLSIKPMTGDEAVMQMDLIDQEFLVFRNFHTQRMNVIFRRKDGHYGLIDPEE